MSLPLMYVQRLRVAQLRKFEQLELTDLAPGLNILAGPNGVGKSTLHRAVRAAFLDRYSSNATAADLLPLGNTGAAPTVEVDFVLQGGAAPLDQDLSEAQTLRFAGRRANA